MTRLLSFFGGWQGWLALVLAGLLAGSIGTWRVMSWREGAQETKFAVQQIRLTDKDIHINMSIGDVVVQGVQIINTETVRLVREIPQHVTPEIDRNYPMPLGFVRVWNDASAGTIPGPAAGSDADPSGVPASTVAYAHTEDAATIKTCHVYLNAWWAWYDQHAAAHK